MHGHIIIKPEFSGHKVEIRKVHSWAITELTTVTDAK